MSKLNIQDTLTKFSNEHNWIDYNKFNKWILKASIKTGFWGIMIYGINHAVIAVMIRGKALFRCMVIKNVGDADIQFIGILQKGH